MTDRLGSLARGTLIYGVGQALSRSMALMLMPVLTVYLDPASYGILAVLTAFGLLLHTIFSVGLGAATAPSYFEGSSRQEKNSTIWTAFAILVLSSSLMMAVAAAFSPQIARVILQDESYGRMVVLAAGATAFSILAVPFRQFLMFEERPALYVWLSLGSLCVSLVLTVWMVAWLGRGLVGVLEADLIGQAVTCALLALPVIFGSPFEVRRKVARDLVALGLPLIPAFASLFVLQHGSRYILQWLQGPAQVGIYAVGLNIAAAVGLLVAGFQSAWLPYFMSYAQRPEEARIALGRAATYYVISVGTASLLLYIFARAAVMVLAAPEYRGADHVVGLAASTQFLSGLFLVLLPGMYFAREVYYLGVVQALAGGVAVVLNLALVPWLGYVGSALAVLLSYVFLIVGQFCWNRRRGYLSVRYEWYRLRSFGILYVGIALLSYVPRNLTVGAECGAASAAAFVALTFVWRLLSPSERAVLRGWCSRRTSEVTEASARAR